MPSESRRGIFRFSILTPRRSTARPARKDRAYDVTLAAPHTTSTRISPPASTLVTQRCPTWDAARFDDASDHDVAQILSQRDERSPPSHRRR